MLRSQAVNSLLELAKKTIDAAVGRRGRGIILIGVKRNIDEIATISFPGYGTRGI